MPVPQQKTDFALAVTSILMTAYPEAAEGMPPKLWHYTTYPTLLNILESKSLWATHVSCVNDTSEVRHLFDLIFEQLDSWSAASGAEPVIEHIKSLRRKDHGASCDWFTTSFCTKGDELNLWRAYAGPDGGVAIGFNSIEAYRRALNVDKKHRPQGLPETYLLPVLYNSAKKKALVNDLLHEIERKFIDSASKCGNIETFPKSFWATCEDQIAVIAPLIKHEAFEAENEWRLITKFGGRALSSLKFVARRTTVTRHLPLNLEQVEGDDQPVLPIVEIKIGPGIHQGITKANVEELLRSKGYPGVCVACSSIPFRSL